MFQYTLAKSPNFCRGTDDAGAVPLVMQGLCPWWCRGCAPGDAGAVPLVMQRLCSWCCRAEGLWFWLIDWYGPVLSNSKWIVAQPPKFWGSWLPASCNVSLFLACCLEQSKSSIRRWGYRAECRVNIISVIRNNIKLCAMKTMSVH